jgi:8-oxo-dGTP diphosphatase
MVGDSNILKNYSNKLRVRVCGILIENDSILLVRHKNIGEKGILWSPPGGGVEFGTSLKENLIREFKEETGLKIEVCDFLYASEFLNAPLHAIELFFEVKFRNGVLKIGLDPELPLNDQIIEEVCMVNFQRLKKMEKEILHSTLRSVNNASELLNRRGIIYFENNI